MSISNGRYSPRPSVSLELKPGQATEADFAWICGSFQENGSRWKSRTLPSFMNPINTVLEESRSCLKENIGLNLAMNSITLPVLDEGHQKSSTLAAGFSPNRFLGIEHLDSPVHSTRFQVHDRFQNLYRSYDKEMLSKLDFKGNRKNESSSYHTRPFIFSSTQDISPSSHLSYGRHTQLKPLSLSNIPVKTIVSDSPCRRPDPAPVSSFCYQTVGSLDSKLPPDVIDFDRSSIPSSLLHSASKFQVDNNGFDSNHRYRLPSTPCISLESKEEFREDRNSEQPNVSEKSHHINPYSPGVVIGKRRRAFSPAEKEDTPLLPVGSSNDLIRSRELATYRNSTDLRFHSHRSSISSITSDPRNNSCTSSMSATTSSRTSIDSFGWLSPDSASPKCIDGTNPRTTLKISNLRRQGSLSRSAFRQKQSDSRISKIPHKTSQSYSHNQHNKILSIYQGKFVCECCPKKPKKFDTKEELEAHEQEKQYECAFCPNRFKNKNEAERHQNSLHLRLQSWSCAALSSYHAAFHNSSTRPNEADTCGYCGEDFPRSGMLSAISTISKQDWDVRMHHLTEKHKFRECNLKKFFRADHFRQHLKHSHAGTSGKWTNMLENACMRDEPLPLSTIDPEKINLGGSQISGIFEEKTNFPIDEDSLGRSTSKFLKVT